MNGPRQKRKRAAPVGARAPSTAPRRVRSDAERQAKERAILDAALDVFAESGFAPARLEEVAARAGVAKGTIYLYFPSKQALFEALIRTGIGASIEAAGAEAVALDLPFEAVVRGLFTRMRREILATRRKEIIRLVIAESGRFPEVAEFYYREVVARGMALLRAAAERAVARGELSSDELARFPQLVVAPGGGAYLWMSAEEDGPKGFQGYVEGNLVYMAPEEGGRIETMAVEAGDDAREGDLLFGLESSMQIAQKNEAEARLSQAEAQLANLKAAMQRPEQIAVLRVQEERAKAQAQFSRNEHERQQTLFQRGIAAKAQLDNAKAALDRDQAGLEEAQRAILAAQLAGRSGEIGAAEAALRAAEAAVAQAETRLARRRVSAPANAKVQDVFFRAGEVVNAGQPVLSLLPPQNLRLRFYVPEPVLATFALGQTVAVACDSCPAGIEAKVSFISREAEYTPPVIFSEQERAKLVFRIEARPAAAMNLPIGLPVSVRPLPARGS